MGEVIVEYQRILEALNRSAGDLGILPEVAALRPQVEVHLLETLPSTNQYAWGLVEQGAGAGTVVIARQQSAGRGQWGRSWSSPPGGLYLSLVLEPDLAVGDRLMLTLASAWGMAQSLETLGLPIQLKWPNDLVSQGKKVGGILTETRLRRPVGNTPEMPSAPRLQIAVIGVGLNWDNPVPPTACSLRQLLPDPPPEGLKSLEDLAAIALRGILQGYYIWQHRGTSAFLASYQQKLSNVGQKVQVDGHLGTVSGVSATGELRVTLDSSGGNLARFLKPGEISLGYND